ncbi:MAG: hypothetical protein V9E88_09230 [Ferruginibacter sp.]
MTLLMSRTDGGFTLNGLPFYICATSEQQLKKNGKPIPVKCTIILPAAGVLPCRMKRKKKRSDTSYINDLQGIVPVGNEASFKTSATDTAVKRPLLCGLHRPVMVTMAGRLLLMVACIYLI